MNLAGVNKKQEDADAAIVERVQHGDLNAYNLLVAKYQHKIFQVISKFLGESADISDVAQETFIKAYKAISSFRGESSFYTWLYRIAVNCTKTYLESNARHRGHVDVDADDFESLDTSGALASKETPDRIIESEELQQVILNAINELSYELKQAIMLREVEGLSYDEIADISKVPIGTVRSRIFRARQIVESKMSKFD